MFGFFAEAECFETVIFLAARFSACRFFKAAIIFLLPVSLRRRRLRVTLPAELVKVVRDELGAPIVRNAASAWSIASLCRSNSAMASGMAVT